MSKQRNPNSDPDPADRARSKAGGTSVERLMAEAEALAKELGVEVGAPTKEAGPSSDAAGPREDSSADPGVQEGTSDDPVARVEQVEQKLARTAEEIGREQPEAGPSVEVSPSTRPKGTTIADLDPSEWQAADQDIPTLDQGDAGRPGPGPTAAQKSSAEGSFAQKGPARAAVRPAASSKAPEVQEEVGPVDAPVEGRLGRWLRKLRVPGPLAARVLVVAQAAGHKLDFAAGRTLAYVRVVLVWWDKPFGWVPLKARLVIGYVAVLTLAMAVITFAVGWFR